MKHKKWLLIVLLVILLLNLIFYLIFKFGKIDQLIKTKLHNYAAEQLNSELTFENLALNEKQLNVSRLKLKHKENQYSVTIEQIYIQYNLPKLILSGFKNLKAIKLIKIFQPEIHIKIDQAKQKKNKSAKFKIPDITSYFQELNISDGKLLINYRNNTLSMSDSLASIELNISNTDHSNINIAAKSSNSTINGFTRLQDGQIKESNIKIDNYNINKLQLNVIDSLYGKLDIEFEQSATKSTFKGQLSSLKLKKNNYTILSDYIPLQGNQDSLEVLFPNLKLDNQNFYGYIDIYNFLSKDRYLKAKLNSDSINLHRYVKPVTGIASAKLSAAGKITNPIVKGFVHTDSIEISNQNIENIKVYLNYQNQNIAINLAQAYWSKNKIEGNGNYKIGDKLNLGLAIPSFNYKKYGIDFKGKLEANINYDEVFDISLNSNAIQVSHPQFELEDLILKANLKDDNYLVQLQKDETIQLFSQGHIGKKTLDASLKLRRLSLNRLFDEHSLPLVSGRLNLLKSRDSLIIDNSLRIYDQHFGKLDGKFDINYKADLNNEKAKLAVSSFNAKYNYEDFEISLLASGNLDSLKTEYFKINEDITLDAQIRKKPTFDYTVQIHGKEIKISDYLQYFTTYEFANRFHGTTDFELEYSNQKQGSILGVIHLDDIRYKQMQSLYSNIQFFGNKHHISLNKFTIDDGKNILAALSGELHFQPQKNIKILGNLYNIDLQKMFPYFKAKGDLNGEISYYGNNDDNILDVNLLAKKIDINGLEADSIAMIFSQQNDILKLIKLSARKKRLYHLFASGKLGYNLFSGNIITDTSTIKLNFTGDLLKILDNQSDFITAGNSNCSLNLTLGTDNNNLSLPKGSLVIDKGNLKLSNQLTPVEKLRLNWNINDNNLNIDTFSGKIGENKLFISNKINHDENDLRLGQLNLGNLNISTEKSGILVNIPGYIPKNSLAKLKLKGKNSDYMKITGPFEDINIVGEIIVSDGSLIYPPNTENLLNFIDRMKKKDKDDDNKTMLPFSFDLLFSVGKNLYYTTYPINLTIKEDGFINLKYDKDNFSVENAIFESEKGYIEIFGSQMQAEYVQIIVNQISGFKISGSFYKTIADGTIISLQIHNRYGNIQFDLESDKSGDNQFDIISLLHYGKRADELDSIQRKNVLQNEFVQLAGLGIETSFITPIFHPIESSIRQVFRLDYFYIRTDIIQNIFQTYSSQNNEIAVTDDKKISKFGTDIFLNNLTIGMAKNITGNLLLDYEVKFQKPSEIVLESDMGIYHTFGIKYNLPYKVRVGLQYKINPFNEKNAQEISLERSWQFW